MHTQNTYISLSRMSGIDKNNKEGKQIDTAAGEGYGQGSGHRVKDWDGDSDRGSTREIIKENN